MSNIFDNIIKTILKTNEMLFKKGYVILIIIGLIILMIWLLGQ